jgi:O-antigen/teichoic acid export membrane protein
MRRVGAAGWDKLRRARRANAAVVALPVSQAMVVAVSIVGFAILARMLGPEPFGLFAAVLLIFTVSSLVADLAPQAFILVHGGSSATYSAARVTAVLSFLGSVCLVSALLAVYSAVSAATFFDPVVLALLCIALAGQFGMQSARAWLTLQRRYKGLGAIDVVGTVLGVLVAVGLGRAGVEGLHVLSVQLASTLVVRMVLGVLMRFVHSGRAGRNIPDYGSVMNAFRFGLRVIPLNLASYLTRSLDSGIMPAVLSPMMAGVYARSYQLVVAPVSQVQISLGPVVLRVFGEHARLTSDPAARVFRTAFVGFSAVSVLAGLVVASLSSLITDVVFGDGWPMADVMLCAMAATLPALALSSYLSWIVQVFPKRLVTVRHLACVLVGPLAAIVGAAGNGISGALVGLVVVGGLVTPLLLLVVYRSLLPFTAVAMLGGLVCEWAVLIVPLLVRII